MYATFNKLKLREISNLSKLLTRPNLDIDGYMPGVLGCIGIFRS